MATRRHPVFGIQCLFLAWALLLGAIACGPSPKKVTENYLQAIQAGDAEKARQWATPGDQSAKPIEELKAELDPNHKTALERTFDDRSSFEILDDGKEGDTAWVKYSFQKPDYDLMRSDQLLLAKAMRQSGDDKEKERLLFDQLLAEKFQSTPIPMISGEEKLNLVKVDKKWKLRLGWKEAKQRALADAKRRKEMAQREALYLEKMEQATHERRFQNFENATVRLNEALAAMPAHKDAIQKLKKAVKKEKEEHNRKYHIREQLHVEKIETKKIVPKRKTNKPYLRVGGTLVNDSRAMLSVVTIGIDLLDSAGQPLERIFYNPWDMETLDTSTPRARSPFEPTYRHEFVKRIYSQPEGFSGNVKITVTDFRPFKKKKKKR